LKNGYWIAIAAASLLMMPRVQPGNRMNLPSFRGIAEVCASIPGRLRLYMPAVGNDPEAAARMKRQMEETGAVHSVTVNPATGSVLFLYDEKQVEAAVVEGAAIRLMGLDEAIRRQPVSKMEKSLRTLWVSARRLSVCTRRMRTRWTASCAAAAWISGRGERTGKRCPLRN